MTRMEYIVIAIVIMSLATYFTRLLPFLFFSRRKPPQIILYIEKYLPPAIMMILILYCLKDVQWMKNYGIPELSAILLTAGLHLWKRNALLSIFSGTLYYMVMIQAVFKTV
ncbi:MAG: branched-chain amino acid transporter AzlD [Spirochaetes bacterium GWB1_36_13]|nr:MAG: branched-chain amino acid transporter AzlD [Spirochaetes bacterium GWB1_36_13]